MNLRRLIMMLISYTYRKISSRSSNVICWSLVIGAAIIFFIVTVSAHGTDSVRSSETIFDNDDIEEQLSETDIQNEKNLHTIKNLSSSSFTNETNKQDLLITGNVSSSLIFNETSEEDLLIIGNLSSPLSIKETNEQDLLITGNVSSPLFFNESNEQDLLITGNLSSPMFINENNGRHLGVNRNIFSSLFINTTNGRNEHFIRNVSTYLFVNETKEQSRNSANLSLSLSINETDHEKLSKESGVTIPSDPRLSYSFVDIDHLGVDINHLNEEYRPPEQLNIDRPSLHSHSYSRILNVQGNASTIIYNRIPQSYEFTMRSLLESLSYLHTYTYIPSKIYVPFSYNKSALISIARSLNKHQFKQLIYERHLYFFDFYALTFPEHPVWINLVRDPIYRVAAEYENSRIICRKLKRCFVPPDRVNETLDQCVERRSALECITPRHGVSRMLPFFCGLTYPGRCQKENNWALDQAKFNIDFFYTVVGIAEEFYKFLYVLEKLLPQYFKLARLVFMNQQDTKLLADERDVNIRLPNENTTQLLRPLLKYEYNLYDYIKERLLDQYRILMELDN